MTHSWSRTPAKKAFTALCRPLTRAKSLSNFLFSARPLVKVCTRSTPSFVFSNSFLAARSLALACSTFAPFLASVKFFFSILPLARPWIFTMACLFFWNSFLQLRSLALVCKIRAHSLFLFSLFFSVLFMLLIVLILHCRAVTALAKLRSSRRPRTRSLALTILNPPCIRDAAFRSVASFSRRALVFSENMMLLAFMLRAAHWSAIAAFLFFRNLPTWSIDLPLAAIFVALSFSRFDCFLDASSFFALICRSFFWRTMLASFFFSNFRLSTNILPCRWRSIDDFVFFKSVLHFFPRNMA
mmetsp:Transcript_15474/g.28907  ORF Transcript_15474/g.28907 Transcript_15474/m.28907 type:complete len:299 (-) Transcript_15474:1255-2151(-)